MRQRQTIRDNEREKKKAAKSKKRRGRGRGRRPEPEGRRGEEGGNALGKEERREIGGEMGRERARGKEGR